MEEIKLEVSEKVEREMDIFLSRLDVKDALEKETHVVHIAVMQGHRTDIEWNSNFFQFAAYPLNGGAWGEKSNKKVKADMIEKPMLLLIGVGDSPLHGNIGESAAVNHALNVRGVPISNDLVSAKNGNTKGGAVPVYQDADTQEFYSHKSELPADWQKR